MTPEEWVDAHERALLARLEAEIGAPGPSPAREVPPKPLSPRQKDRQRPHRVLSHDPIGVLCDPRTSPRSPW